MTIHPAIVGFILGAVFMFAVLSVLSAMVAKRKGRYDR